MRNRILDGAERLFRDQSYGGLRVDELAEFLGISKKTLYNHFSGGKRDILHSCIERRIASFSDRLEAIVGDFGGDYIQRSAHLLDISQEAFEVFQGPSGLVRSTEDEMTFIPLLKERNTANLVQFFKEGIAKGFIISDLPLLSTAKVIIELVVAWSRKDSPLLVGETPTLKEFLQRVLFIGMLTPHGRDMIDQIVQERGRQ